MCIAVSLPVSKCKPLLLHLFTSSITHREKEPRAFKCVCLTFSAAVIGWGRDLSLCVSISKDSRFKCGVWPNKISPHFSVLSIRWDIGLSLYVPLYSKQGRTKSPGEVLYPQICGHWRLHYGRVHNQPSRVLSATLTNNRATHTHTHTHTHTRMQKSSASQVVLLQEPDFALLMVS